MPWWSETIGWYALSLSETGGTSTLGWLPWAALLIAAGVVMVIARRLTQSRPEALAEDCPPHRIPLPCQSGGGVGCGAPQYRCRSVRFLHPDAVS